MSHRSRFNDIPNFPIAPILRELGFDNVPDVREGFVKILCAFHPDTTPSAGVGAYSFVCWGCDERGDAISLIRRHEGLSSFADAVARCEELCGVTGRPVPQPTRDRPSLLGDPGDHPPDR